LVVPGADSLPQRPKIVLPGLGIVDPNLPPAVPEEPVPEAQYGEEWGEAAVEAIYDEPVAAEPDGAWDESGATSGSGEFMMQPDDEEVPLPRGRVPELRAAPAELADLQPRPLGPPPGYESAAYEPEPEGVEYEAEPEPEYEPEYAAEPEYAVEAVDPDPVAAEQPPPRRASSRVPVPLTSRQSLSSLHARRLTQQVHAESAATQAAMAAQAAAEQALAAAQAMAAQAQAQASQAAARPHPHFVAPVPVRVLPAWVLVVCGVVLGLIAGVVAVVHSPLGDKFGMVAKDDAEKRARRLLAVERAEVQQMLKSFFRGREIDLATEMDDFRTERGLRAPETRSPEQLAAAAGAPEAAPAEEEEEKEEADVDGAEEEEEEEEAAPEENAEA
jgi:hypothetical protein